jgi:DNA-binding beta-propeller fold protein YncE
MRLRSLLPVAAAAVLIAPLAAVAAPAPAALPEEAGKQGTPAQGSGVDLTPVSNWSYKGGTDLEFATLKGRDYAIAPSEKVAGGVGALRIFDLTANPAKPKLVGFLECNVSQNDVQVHGTTVFMGVDYDEQDAECFRQAGAAPAPGVLSIDISNPRKPRAIGFIPIGLGAHNTTLHPSGKFLYVSDSELTPYEDEPTGAQLGRINVVDVSNPKKMKEVFKLGLPSGLSSHDVDFNAKGDRAYSAAITQTLILDTTDPAKPSIATTILDPAVNISHGADLSPDETHLYVTDEQAGAAANGVCNVGGVHVYDLTKPVPVKTGFYAFSPADSLTSTLNNKNLTCTAHVLDFGPTGKTFSNAGYAAGVRVVDIANRIGKPADLATFTPVDADTWSAKQYKNPKYLYANDLARGFDVYEYAEGKGVVDTRSAKQIQYGITRVGDTTFLNGAWCADAKGALKGAPLMKGHHLKA